MSEIMRIKLENFQSHRDTILEPAPAGQLTVIVGPSDSGKTAILRALRWLFYNVPQGADFIRVGATVARVRIDYAGRNSVIRERSQKGFNRYEISSQEKTEPDRYEGFGGAVPFEVQQLTSVRPVQIGDMTLNLNLADQLSGPFLGSDISAPMRAKVLGKLAGTEEIDHAARGVGTDLHRRRQDERRYQDDVARLQGEIEKYAYLEELGTRIEQADALLAGIRDNMQKLTELKRLQEQGTQIHEQWENTIKRLIYLSNIIGYSEPFIANAEQNLDRYTQLRDLFDRWGKNAIDLSFQELTLERTAWTREASARIFGMSADIAQLTNLAAVKGRLDSNMSELTQVEVIMRSTQWVPEAEILHSCTAKCHDRFALLNRSWAALSSLNLRLQTIQAMLDATRDIDTAYLQAKVLQDKIATLASLRNASERLLSHAQSIGTLESRLEGLAGIDEAEAFWNTVQIKLSQVERLMPLRNNYNANEISIGILGDQATEFAEQEKWAFGQYRDALLIAGVCPVCGSQVNEDKIKEVV